MKINDVIRDFSEIDSEMKNIWVYHSKNYVLYRIVKITKNTIECIRMASPNHTKDVETKNFIKNSVKHVSQTIGIFEFNGV